MKKKSTGTGLAALLALALAAGALSCASPYSVLLSFTATTVIQTTSTVSQTYSWAFSSASALPPTGVEVAARLYKEEAGSRKLAAESSTPISLTAISGSGTCTFSGTFPSGNYTAEYAVIDSETPHIYPCTAVVP